VVISTPDTTLTIKFKNATPKIVISLLLVEYGSGHKKCKIYQFCAAEDYQ
jgi:hypothetical protein